MDNINSTQFIYQSQYLQQRVQNIAGELDQSPTTNKKFRDLTNQIGKTSSELDEISKNLKAISEQSTAIIFVKDVIDGLGQDIVKLSGRLITSWVKEQVLQIHREAVSVDRSLKCGKVTTKDVENLASHLQALKCVYRPSVSERQMISEAEFIMYRANAFLRGENEEIEKPPPQLHEQSMIEAFDMVRLGEMEELLELAVFIHDGDFHQAKTRFNQLSEEYKKRFREHMTRLNAVAFIDSFESIQAFLAMANELVNNGEGYPTRDQVNEFFLELAQIHLQEESGPKIFSLRSRVSLPEG